MFKKKERGGPFDSGGRIGEESRIPKLTILATICLLGLILGVNFGYEWMNESFNLLPAYRQIFTGLLVMVIALIWVIWLLFFSWFPRPKRYVLFALGLLVVGTLAVLFKPVTGGDLAINRWEPRFWGENEKLPEAEVPSPVDLSLESEVDFNQFLGSKRNGVVSHLRLSDDWKGSNSPRLVWRQSIGQGWSGFAAVNGFAVTQEQRGADECVTCYDILSGRMQWIYKAARRHRDSVNLGKSGPRATPTIHDGKVFVQGATGLVTCLNGTDGKVIWEIDLTDQLDIQMIPSEESVFVENEFSYENSALAWGRSGSPLIVDDKVVVTGGGPRGGPFKTIFALDKTTGETVWTGGEDMIAYGSPSLMNLAGRRQIVLVAESKAMGFDAGTGQELWSHDRPGFSDQDANCSQATFVNENQILLSKGYSMGGELLEVENVAGGIEVSSDWTNVRVLKTKMTSPVVFEGHAYCLSDGFLECTEIASGIRKWKKRGRFGDGQILLVQDKLLVHGERGTLHLFSTDTSRANEIDTIRTIDGICWNTICLYDRYLIVRSEIEAACFELMVGVGPKKEKPVEVEVN